MRVFGNGQFRTALLAELVPYLGVRGAISFSYFPHSGREVVKVALQIRTRRRSVGRAGDRR